MSKNKTIDCQAVLDRLYERVEGTSAIISRPMTLAQANVSSVDDATWRAAMHAFRTLQRGTIN